MQNKIVAPFVLLKEHSFTYFVIYKRTEEGIKRSHLKSDRCGACIEHLLTLVAAKVFVYLEWGEKKSCLLVTTVEGVAEI